MFNSTEAVRAFSENFERGNTTLCPENLCVPQDFIRECVSCQSRFIDGQTAFYLLIIAFVIGVFIGIMLLLTYMKIKE